MMFRFWASSRVSENFPSSSLSISSRLASPNCFEVLHHHFLVVLLVECPVLDVVGPSPLLPRLSPTRTGSDVGLRRASSPSATELVLGDRLPLLHPIQGDHVHQVEVRPRHEYSGVLFIEYLADDPHLDSLRVA